jgi:hypothetical protein
MAARGYRAVAEIDMVPDRRHARHARMAIGKLAAGGAGAT